MSDESGFESLALAKQFRAWITAEVAAQIQKIAPRRRIAEVVSIDLESRRAEVTYVGETSVVSLPFNVAMPSYVGQYVVIDGPPQDRSIVDVLGESGVEQRIGEVEESTPLPPYWARPSLSALETVPARLIAYGENAGRFFSNGDMALTPVRITHAATYSKISVRIEDIGVAANMVEVGAYRLNNLGAGPLISSAPARSVAKGTMVFDLDTVVDEPRGTIIGLGMRVSGSSSQVKALAHQHFVSPLGLGLDYSYAFLTSTTALPASADRDQMSPRQDYTVWSALH